MTVFIPQYDNSLGESFASMLSNEISGVQFMNDKIWLVVSPTGDITSWWFRSCVPSAAAPGISMLTISKKLLHLSAKNLQDLPSWECTIIRR